MRFTFYRPQNVNITEFDNIIGKMQYDLNLLLTSQNDEWDVYRYIYDICRLAKELDKNPKMKFLGLDEPSNMPSDSRVEFFYKPTYIATAFIMKAVLLYPSLFDESAFLDSDLDFSVETVKSTLASLMLGCTGRNFDGAGVYKTTECIKMFEDAGTSEFIAKYPDICPEFTEMYREVKSQIEKIKGHLSSDQK